MPTYALILQTDYHDVQVGLLKDSILIHQAAVEKIHASRFLMDSLLSLLTKHNLTWQDLSYLGVNQGPGPFTTLRAIIATVNGIGFARRIPLIGVDGLNAFLEEQSFSKTTIALLNAFNKDLYFGIKEDGKVIKTGWQEGTSFLKSLSLARTSEPLSFVGNGVPLFKDDVVKLFGSYALIPDPLPHAPSLQTIANNAQKQWENEKKEIYKLIPLYLKSHNYKASCSS